ncbi:hypothetical protein ABZ467_30765 [Streptomyces sp. NPDC005727]|uniref:hypothetical protein n=1 Tax=Streptomyces sp. NPDC005727 TaxID=3157053 RepID=UPI0033E7F5D5
METDLSSFTNSPKISVEDVAEQTMDALANDRVELPTDERASQVKHALSQPVER